MPKSARQAAIDQADMLVSYLSITPSDQLDLDFIRRHLETIHEFALAACRERELLPSEDAVDGRIEATCYILD